MIVNGSHAFLNSINALKDYDFSKCQLSAPQASRSEFVIKGLRTKENFKFLRFWKIVQDSANAMGKIFFLIAERRLF